MAYVISEPWIGVKDDSCVEVCPVDCIHPTPDEPDYGEHEFLTDVGGHIGYAVRPRHRRRGFASEILRQSLIVARSKGVDRVLVTCDDDNLASAGAIEHLGGVLEDVRPDTDGTRKRRYWITYRLQCGRFGPMSRGSARIFESRR